MNLIAALAVFSLALTACSSNEPANGTGASSTVLTSRITSSTTATNSPPTEEVTLDWPTGTVTCAEMEGAFPLGVDDHGIYPDRGLVSYYRINGTDSVEEIFVQFLEDPTCTVDSEAWTFMIQGLLDTENLHRSGHLCDFYSNLQSSDPPPTNLDGVLEQLAEAEQLCS